MTELKTRFVGNCPVCERDQRLRDGKMVHHGYLRPGDGFIHGDCPGVQFPAYELSTLGCEHYLKGKQEQRVSLLAFLGQLERGEIRTLHKEVYDGMSRFPKLVPVSADSQDPQELALFARLLKAKIGQTKGHITSCEFEITRMEKRIAAWTLKAVRTLEEAAAQEAARTAPEKAAKKAERDAKRAAKAKKAAELKAKRDGWEADKQAMIKKYSDLFKAFSTSVESKANTRASAVLAWKEMYKAMNKRSAYYFYPRALECDEALLSLGLAKMKDNFCYYANEFGHLFIS